MKKTILFIAFIALSYVSLAQNAENMYLNEIFITPNGTPDSPNEYIELRGPAGTTIASDIYLVTVEGDGANEVGDLDEIISLGGLTFGSNGYLVLLTTGHPYTVDANATIALDLTDGDVEDHATTVFLIKTNTAPAGSDDIDTDNDGTPDGTVYEGWTVLDAISILDEDDRDAMGDSGEFAYAPIVFAQYVNEDPMQDDESNIFFPAGAEVLYTTKRASAFQRIGNSVGSTSADWAGGATSGSVPDWTFSTTSGRTLPEAYGGEALNHIGAENIVPAVLSTPKFSNESFAIYSPSRGVFKIETRDNFTVKSLEVFNTLGQSVKRKTYDLTTLNLTYLRNGVFFISVNDGPLKKIAF